MKILIVSDTHRVDDILKKVISIEKPFDMFIHLGDGEGSETKISLMLDPTCACLMVQGNNDFFSQLPAEKEINIKNHKALLVHGHQYGVSMDISILKDEAIARGCDFAMYGHTQTLPKDYRRSDRTKPGFTRLSETGRPHTYIYGDECRR